MAKLKLFVRQNGGHIGYADCVRDLLQMARCGSSSHFKIPTDPRINGHRDVKLSPSVTHWIAFIHRSQLRSHRGHCQPPQLLRYAKRLPKARLPKPCRDGVSSPLRKNVAEKTNQTRDLVEVALAHVVPNKETMAVWSSARATALGPTIPPQDRMRTPAQHVPDRPNIQLCDGTRTQ